MSDSLIVPVLYLTSLIVSAVFFLRDRKSRLLGIIAFLFVLGIAIPILFSWVLFAGNYDHGTAGEALPTAGVMMIWSLAVVASSVELARKLPDVPALLPILFVTTALLVMMAVASDFQRRFDFYHDFYFFNQAQNPDR